MTESKSEIGTLGLNEFEGKVFNDLSIAIVCSTLDAINDKARLLTLITSERLTPNVLIQGLIMDVCVKLVSSLMTQAANQGVPKKDVDDMLDLFIAAVKENINEHE